MQLQRIYIPLNALTSAYPQIDTDDDDTDFDQESSNLFFDSVHLQAVKKNLGNNGRQYVHQF